MGYEFLLSLLALIVGGAWHYGSSGPDKRENFRLWLSQLTQQAKPIAARSGLRFIFLIVFVGAAIIAWSSAKEIYDFRFSPEPITRRDVMMLILSAFNLLVYSSTSVVLATLAANPFPKKRVPLILKEGEPVSFRLQGSTDAEALKKALQEGVTVTFSIDSKRQVQIDTENLNGISLSQLPTTPSSSTTIKD